MPTPLERRNHELSILNTIAEALNRSVDLDEILRVTLEQLAKLLALHTSWVWLYESEAVAQKTENEDPQHYLAAAQNLPPALTEKPERMAGPCMCLDTYRSGDLDGAANVNVLKCTRLKSLSEGTDGLRYHTSIPLYAHGKKLGILNVASTDWRELSPEDLRLLYTVGDMLSIAIERARLFNRSMQIGALEERNRLAREIHDTLAQGLSAIAMQLETADALMDAPPKRDADPQQIRAPLQKALTLARATLDEARRSVMDLRAAPLEGRTLAQALAKLADTYRNTRNLHVIFSPAGEHHPLPPRIEAGLYRVAQEALTNIQKHAHAQNVRLRLITSPQRVRLTIKDDGIGFDPQRIPANRFGLLGLRERAKLMGGTLEIQTTPGEGTRVGVVVDLQSEEQHTQ